MKIISVILSFFTAISAFFTTYSFTVDTTELGKEVGNKVSNVNVWEMGQSYYDPQINSENNIYDFVEYVQLMQCSGGNSIRDPFVNPQDKTVLDDYDFDRLIENCKGILKVGAKPCLKLGNVPEKFTQESYIGDMECNVYPPDDYDKYYTYMCDLALALVTEFGKEELLTWHYCVMTEAENEQWFFTKNKNPRDCCEAYCKLYDYTVDALQKTIGNNVYVGAHFMVVTEGLWDEADFIKHCGVGTNYKTGKTGSRICFLSASYYESKPGEVGDRKTLPQTINYLRDNAEKYGLKDLDYGIDEGRVLVGTVSGKDSDNLYSRTVGYQWQAAFDARIYSQMIENDIDYFSHWSYFSEGLSQGNPTLSYHIAKRISAMKNSRIAKVTTKWKALFSFAEVKVTGTFDEEQNTLYMFGYNYKNKLNYNKSVNVKIQANVPQFKGDKALVTKYVIDENCNYFDDWIKDREKYNITDDCFGWSPQCPNINASLGEEWAREIYYGELYEKYKECSKLTPVKYEVEIVDGTIEIEETIGANNVVFYEISQ